MSNPRLDLQKEIYAALTGDAQLSAKISGVFDFVPESQTFPFIQIGETEFQEFGTQSHDGFSATIIVNLWHRPGSRGRAPLLDIMNDIYRVLHKRIFTITNFNVISMRFDFSNVIVEEDTVTYHGITRFKLLMGEN